MTAADGASGSTIRHELGTLERRWGLALQSAAFGVWDLDIVAQRVHYSPQWKVMLGYDATDVPDATAVWRGRVHPDDLEPMLSALHRHIEHRTPVYEHEFRLRAVDGAFRWVQSRGRVVERDADDRPLRMIGTLTDVTDRRDAEALRLARDRAEAASRAKTEFLSAMSHELRTPLNAVLGFAQLLEQRIGKADADEQRRCVERIATAGWQLLAMIDDVLELAQMEKGELTLRIESVPLTPLLQAACDAALPVARQRHVGIARLDMPPHVAVRADAARLAEVAGHLLGNAVKFNRKGGSVTVGVSPRSDGAWTLSIADTGVGIGPAQMAHLFEPFNRLGQAKSAIAGVGVGLLLTRRLVESMGGTVSARSTEGEGSIFEVHLPAAPSAPAPAVKQGATPPASGSPR